MESKMSDDENVKNKTTEQAQTPSRNGTASRTFINLKDEVGNPPPFWATTITKVGAICVGLIAIESVALGVYGMINGRAYNYGIFKNSSGLFKQEIDGTIARKIGTANLVAGVGLGALSLAVSSSAETASKVRNFIKLNDKINANEREHKQR
jgi:hypothetical protein